MASPSKVSFTNTTGDITTETTLVRSFTLSAGASNATAVLKAGGSGGTTLGTFTTLANTSFAVDLHDGQFTGGLYVSLSGSGATATIAHL